MPTITVDATATETATTFNTISGAIIAAQSGDTIQVLAGTYNEDLTVDKTLTFLGANQGLAGNDETRGGETVITGTGISISGSATGVTFDGFTLSPQNAVNAIEVIGEDFTVTNSVITAHTYQKASGLTYTNNKAGGISGQGDYSGNVIVADSSAELSGWTITGNEFHDFDRGVVMASSGTTYGNIDISNNSFDNFTGRAVQIGDDAVINDTITISGNMMSNATGPGGGAIRFVGPVTLDDGVGVTIENNTLENLTFGFMMNNSPDAAGKVTFDQTSNTSTNVDTVAIYSPAPNAVDARLAFGDETLTFEDLTITFDDGTGTYTAEHDGASVTFFGGVETLSFGAEDVHLVGAGAFASIQAAVDAAADGDTIMIGPGTFNERVEITVENLTLTTDPTDPATLTYDGADFYPVMEIFADGVTVENFDIVRENGTRGAQAIAVRTSDVSVLNNTIEGINTSAPGITVDHGLPGNGYDADVSNVLLDGNTINGDFSWGFGIRSEGTTPTKGSLDGVTVTNNTVNVSGNGIFLFDVNGGAQITNLDVSSNAFTIGGTLFAYDNIGLIDAGTFVAANDLEGGAAWIDGSPFVYTSIQAAVDAATADDTINVAAGAYDENVTIDKAVTLVGPNAGLTGHDAGRGAEASIEGNVVITADGATLSGFTLTKPAGSTSTNDINFSGWSGINLDVQGDNVTVTDTIVEAFGAGGGFGGSGFVQFGGAGTFDGNLVQAGAGYDAANDARAVSSLIINADTDDAVTVNNNHLLVSTNVTASPNDADGLFLFNAGEAVISNNLISGTDGGFVAFGNYGPLTLSNNTIENVADTGIRLFESMAATKPDVVLNGNTVTGDNAFFSQGAVKLGEMPGGSGFPEALTNFEEIPSIFRANNLDGNFGVVVDGNLSLFTDQGDATAAAGGTGAIWNFAAEEFQVFDGMSIQAAVDAAADGDTIMIGAGDFSGEGVITVDDKSLTINGALAGTSPVGDNWEGQPADSETVIDRFRLDGTGGLDLDGVRLLGTGPTSGDGLSGVQHG